MTETESQREADINRTPTGMVKIAIRTRPWMEFYRFIPGTALTGVRLTEATDRKRMANAS
jgi:hypothetical protein